MSPHTSGFTPSWHRTVERQACLLHSRGIMKHDCRTCERRRTDGQTDSVCVKAAGRPPIGALHSCVFSPRQAHGDGAQAQFVMCWACVDPAYLHLDSFRSTELHVWCCFSDCTLTFASSSPRQPPWKWIFMNQLKKKEKEKKISTIFNTMKLFLALSRPPCHDTVWTSGPGLVSH